MNKLMWQLENEIKDIQRKAEYLCDDGCKLKELLDLGINSVRYNGGLYFYDGKHYCSDEGYCDELETLNDIVDFNEWDEDEDGYTILRVNEHKIDDEILYQESARLDEDLASEFIEGTPYKCPTDYHSISWLQADIAHILRKADDMDKRLDEIKGIIQKSPYAKDVLKHLNFNSAIIDATTRKDWETALNDVKHGSDISGNINWSFSNEDISNLAILHKRSGKRMKTKIEDLLDDCNFHYESGEFGSGNYDEFIKEAC